MPARQQQFMKSVFWLRGDSLYCCDSRNARGLVGGADFKGNDASTGTLNPGIQFNAEMLRFGKLRTGQFYSDLISQDCGWIIAAAYTLWSPSTEGKPAQAANRQVRPCVGLDVARPDTGTALVHGAQGVLCVRVSLFCRADEPPDGPREIFRHAIPFAVHVAQLELSDGVSLFGSAGVRCDGLNAVHIFFSQDVSLLVQNPIRWVIDSSPYIL